MGVSTSCVFAQALYFLPGICVQTSKQQHKQAQANTLIVLHNEPTERNASDRDDERGKILATIGRNVLLFVCMLLLCISVYLCFNRDITLFCSVL